MRSVALSIVAALVASPASAHPDHGSGGAVGLAHYVTNPFHVAMTLVALGVVVLALGVWRARRGRSTAALRLR